MENKTYRIAQRCYQAISVDAAAGTWIIRRWALGDDPGVEPKKPWADEAAIAVDPRLMPGQAVDAAITRDSWA